MPAPIYRKTGECSMPKVSILLPSLNVVRYIRPCLDSVLHQTLTDLEILCIDAHSTDGTNMRKRTRESG